MEGSDVEEDDSKALLLGTKNINDDEDSTMEENKDDNDESTESLLNGTNDEEEQVQKDLQEAEESIQLLIDVLEEETNKKNSGIGKRTSFLERGPSVENKKVDNNQAVSSTDIYDDANENIIPSAMGSVTDLKLIISENFVPSGDQVRSSYVKPISAGVNNMHDQLRMKLLKEHRSETGKVVCGIVILLIMFGLGATMIVLAWMLNMKDLYILGGIFAAGGVLFAIMFTIQRCKARQENAETDYSVLYKP